MTIFLACVHTSGTLQIKVETTPGDWRFPSANQTKRCFTCYIEYNRQLPHPSLEMMCIAAKGEGSDECNMYAKCYRSLCPGEWYMSTKELETED
ncbi:hypothetical protein ABZP36_024243 [Zizania latifolia]